MLLTPALWVSVVPMERVIPTVSWEDKVLPWHCWARATIPRQKSNESRLKKKDSHKAAASIQLAWAIDIPRRQSCVLAIILVLPPFSFLLPYSLPLSLSTLLEKKPAQFSWLTGMGTCLYLHWLTVWQWSSQAWVGTKTRKWRKLPFLLRR